MKPLFTPQALATLPKLYATDSVKTAKKVAYLKAFDPCGRGTWFLFEYSPQDRLFFGYVLSPLGRDCDELGYIDQDELESVRNRFGLPLELDLHWKPGPIPERE